MSEQTFDDMVREAMQEQHKKRAKRHLFLGVVSIMREDKVGLDEAIDRFRTLGFETIEEVGLPHEAASLLRHEFDIQAEELRTEFQTMREMVALADQAGTAAKEV